jgi:hypothetical protein
VYPDLAFSLPPAPIPRESQTSERRPGLGVYASCGMYGDITHDDKTYEKYTDTLFALVKWLLNRDMMSGY